MNKPTRIFLLGQQNTENAVLYCEHSNGNYVFIDKVNYSVFNSPHLYFVGSYYDHSDFDTCISSYLKDYFGAGDYEWYFYELLPMSLINNQEFRKLADIGGHKTYHLEGNAFTHTLLVYREVRELYGVFHPMIMVALLHDIGKIYTSIKQGEDDWVYPDHSTCGAFKGILAKFVDLSDKNFETYQWYIANHIKPLHWLKKGEIDYSTPVNDNCRTDWLRDLALCDIRGSITEEDNTELIDYLESLI